RLSETIDLDLVARAWLRLRLCDVSHTPSWVVGSRSVASSCRSICDPGCSSRTRSRCEEGLAHARCAAGEEAGQCRRRGIRRGRASTVAYWRRSLRAVESYRPECLGRPAQRAISVRSAAQEMLPLLSSVGGEYSSMVELVLDLAC